MKNELRLTDWSAFELAEAVSTGRILAVDVMRVCRGRVVADNQKLNAFAYLDWESAERDAMAVDAAVSAGLPVGPLAGVPFAVKDTENCAGMPTRYGSLLYEDVGSSSFDDIHVARLRKAGAIPVGKTCAPEFMTGLLTTSRATGVTRNPWNSEISPGGSSGGSAVAVASGMVSFATGSDGGGSLRIPAALCGLVGLKTSFGLVPEWFREPSMLSTIGVLTRTVMDTAGLIDIMQGPVIGDVVSFAAPERIRNLRESVLSVQLAGKRVCYLPSLFGAGVAADVADACRAAFDRCVSSERLVVTGLNDDLQFDDDMNDMFLGVAAAGKWSMLRDGDLAPERQELMTDYVKARLDASSKVTMIEFAGFQDQRHRVAARLNRWFESVDAVIMPSVATCDVPAAGPPPSRVGRFAAENNTAVAPFTRLANIAGIPSVSVPVGIAGNGVPVGVQVCTAWHTDDLALRLGMAMQEAYKPSVLAGTG